MLTSGTITKTFTVLHSYSPSLQQIILLLSKYLHRALGIVTEQSLDEGERSEQWDVVPAIVDVGIVTDCRWFFTVLLLFPSCEDLARKKDSRTVTLT
mmetsp:Transcript_2204/g.4547  ORF Transcript_2204/g.4547 Transcript_2204/m.4547 type:complete len:97 (-) Transcript_2204:82-372(-)